jgi:hypothetical protein
LNGKRKLSATPLRRASKIEGSKKKLIEKQFKGMLASTLKNKMNLCY